MVSPSSGCDHHKDAYAAPKHRRERRVRTVEAVERRDAKEVRAGDTEYLDAGGECVTLAEIFIFIFRADRKFRAALDLNRLAHSCHEKQGSDRNADADGDRQIDEHG